MSLTFLTLYHAHKINHLTHSPVEAERVILHASAYDLNLMIPFSRNKRKKQEDSGNKSSMQIQSSPYSSLSTPAFWEDQTPTKLWKRNHHRLPVIVTIPFLFTSPTYVSMISPPIFSQDTLPSHITPILGRKPEQRKPEGEEA